MEIYICILGILILLVSFSLFSWVMPYFMQKEYARYKQAKGWKHLVVYKSRIHALGLYTSRFISRGEMVRYWPTSFYMTLHYDCKYDVFPLLLQVVEYIGEIVGLRVADKREKEYQSGRKLQYKSACYFFRIDKEHIIDATRKGGIARFVNHSCLVYYFKIWLYICLLFFSFLVLSILVCIR